MVRHKPFGSTVAPEGKWVYDPAVSEVDESKEALIDENKAPRKGIL